jgi:hypothetical protein
MLRRARRYSKPGDRVPRDAGRCRAVVRRPGKLRVRTAGSAVLASPTTSSQRLGNGKVKLRALASPHWTSLAEAPAVFPERSRQSSGDRCGVAADSQQTVDQTAHAGAGGYPRAAAERECEPAGARRPGAGAGLHARGRRRVRLLGQMYHVASGAVYHVENLGDQEAEVILGLRNEAPSTSRCGAASPR